MAEIIFVRPAAVLQDLRDTKKQLNTRSEESAYDTHSYANGNGTVRRSVGAMIVFTVRDKHNINIYNPFHGVHLHAERVQVHLMQQSSKVEELLHATVGR